MEQPADAPKKRGKKSAKAAAAPANHPFPFSPPLLSTNSPRLLPKPASSDTGSVSNSPTSALVSNIRAENPGSSMAHPFSITGLNNESNGARSSTPGQPVVPVPVGQSGPMSFGMFSNGTFYALQPCVQPSAGPQPTFFLGPSSSNASSVNILGQIVDAQAQSQEGSMGTPAISASPFGRNQIFHPVSGSMPPFPNSATGVSRPSSTPLRPVSDSPLNSQAPNISGSDNPFSLAAQLSQLLPNQTAASSPLHEMHPAGAANSVISMPVPNSSLFAYFTELNGQSEPPAPPLAALVPSSNGQPAKDGAPPKPFSPVPAQLPARPLGKPRDLLRHVVQGKTIFEAPNGFSDPQMMTVEKYYFYKTDPKDLREAVTYSPAEDGKDLLNQLSGQRDQKCGYCHGDALTTYFAEKPFCSPRCSMAYTNGASLGENIAAKPTRSRKLTTPGSRRGNPSTIPTAGIENARGVKRKAREVEVVKMRAGVPTPPRKSPLEPEALPDIVAPLKTPSLKKKAGAAKSASSVPEPGSGPSRITVAEHHVNIPHLPRDVMAVAPLIALIRRSPDWEKWKVEDVAVLISGIRGLDVHLPKFVEGEVDGAALKILLGIDEDVTETTPDLGKTMHMPKWAVWKLKNVINLLKPKSEGLENLYSVL